MTRSSPVLAFLILCRLPSLALAEIPAPAPTAPPAVVYAPSDPEAGTDSALVAFADSRLEAWIRQDSLAYVVARLNHPEYAKRPLSAEQSRRLRETAAAVFGEAPAAPVELRRVSAHLLRSAGATDPAALDILRAAADPAGPQPTPVLMAAAASLASYGSAPEVVSSLAAIATSRRDASARLAAARLLGRVGASSDEAADSAAVSALQNALWDQAPEVRGAAAGSLACFNVPGGCENFVLRRALVRESHPAVRDAIQRTLKKLEVPAERPPVIFDAPPTGRGTILR